MEGPETNKGEAVKSVQRMETYVGNSLGFVPTSEWRNISMEEDPAQCRILDFFRERGPQ